MADIVHSIQISERPEASFRLEPVQEGTLVRFVHSGWRDRSEYFTSCNTTWGALMFRLKAAAEGKAPGPLFTREGWVA